MKKENIKKVNKKQTPIQDNVKVLKKVKEKTGRGKIFVGTVTSDKMKNTVVVAIPRRIQHPIYKKFITRTTKLKVDTNSLDIKTGDVVRIEETKKISKDKYFKVIEKIGGLNS